MSEDSGHRIGGDETPQRYAILFLVGVLLGSVVRTVAWLVPSGLRTAVKDRLP